MASPFCCVFYSKTIFALFCRCKQTGPMTASILYFWRSESKMGNCWRWRVMGERLRRQLRLRRKFNHNWTVTKWSPIKGHLKDPLGELGYISDFWGCFEIHFWSMCPWNPTVNLVMSQVNVQTSWSCFRSSYPPSTCGPELYHLERQGFIYESHSLFFSHVKVDIHHPGFRYTA